MPPSRKRIDESIAAIRGGGFLDAMLERRAGHGRRPDMAAGSGSCSSAPDAPHTRYLYHLLASHEFQEGLKNYRDLRIMQATSSAGAGRWRPSTTWSRRASGRGQRREPRQAEVLDRADLEASSSAAPHSATRVEQVAATRDVAALATPKRRPQWQALGATRSADCGAAAGRHSATRSPSAPRLLRGTLAWQFDAEYKLRLSRLQCRPAQTDRALAEARARMALVEQAGELAPRSTAGLRGARGRASSGACRALQPRIDAAAAAQQQMLANIAVRELEAQKARLASYATQAQFALAALYDGAAAGGAQ